MNWKRVLRPWYHRALRLHRRILLVFGKLLFSPNRISSKIVFSYSPGGKFDGLGAQLQRVLGINALGDYWNIKIQHDFITDIAIHPLDEIQKSKDFSVFLRSVNYVVGAFPIEVSESNTLYFNELRFRNVIQLFFASWWKGGKILAKITHPYFFVDANPDIYLCESNNLFAMRLKEFRTRNLSNGIALHHRQGVGNMAVQPGQRTPREISEDGYLQVLPTYLQRKSHSYLYVFTDAPETNIEFTPPVSQRDSWVGLPTFDGKKMSISPNALAGLTSFKEIRIEIFRGGNPLESLANMASCSVLILSRSSFGYVAALLNNQAEVWLPNDFWHRPMSGWKTYIPVMTTKPRKNRAMHHKISL